MEHYHKLIRMCNEELKALYKQKEYFVSCILEWGTRKTFNQDIRDVENIESRIHATRKIKHKIIQHIL